jgi:hypothetical protein
MLTLEVLYAVLQGLPPDYLTFLDEVWRVFCRTIHWELESGADPASAFKQALKKAGNWEVHEINRLFAQATQVIHVPGLSYRQKEVLTALRYSKVASLTSLSRALGADRSNTHRRLDVLVKKGLAFKFYGKGGVCYLAISGPLPKEAKVEIHKFIRQELEFAATRPTTPTTSTTVTTPTMSQKSTTPTTPTTP